MAVFFQFPNQWAPSFEIQGALCLFLLLLRIAGGQVSYAPNFKESKFGLDLTFDIGIQNVHVQWPTPKFLPRNDVPQMLKSGDFDGVRSKHRIGTHFQRILVFATE
jgi:hypothetical protein